MKTGKDINNNIITWNKYTVTIFDENCKPKKIILFSSEEEAKKEFYKLKIPNKQGRKANPYTHQMKVYYNQLIIQC